MNQSSIKPINSVQQAEGNTLSRMLSQIQAEAAAQARSAGREERPQTEIKNEINQVGSLENISIHFRVDEKTNDVTVFLVDRKSKKVLRSIPANELRKLQIGDLLKLTV